DALRSLCDLWDSACCNWRRRSRIVVYGPQRQDARRAASCGRV
ncbi:MAG: hypothetical protein AVDCRST_MAG90-280, partial [uncultured Microvirga sp.]